MCVKIEDNEDSESIVFKNVTLEFSSKKAYLGSVITNSDQLRHVKADIRIDF